MKPEYDTFKQIQWYTEAKAAIKAEQEKAKRDKEFNEYKAEWEVWKLKTGNQNGKWPYAKGIK